MPAGELGEEGAAGLGREVNAIGCGSLTRRGGVLDRRDVLGLMHGRSRMTIDPRIPTIPARGIGGGILRIADILTERLGVCEEFDWVGFLVICSL